MGRVINRLWLRLSLVVLVIQAVLLPPLFFGLDYIVRRSHADAFVDQVRSYARVLGDELEIGDALATRARSLALLDGIILSGRGAYAELIENGQSLRSSLISPSITHYPGDDFEFASGDRIYFLSVPVTKGGRHVVLRLGFDESETQEYIERARSRIAAALLGFMVVSVALTIWLATRIAQPMTYLQNAARRIASGDVHWNLEFASSISEVREVTRHLESMRRELVGTSERLAREVVQRAASDAERRSLEERLRHRERIATIGTLAGGIAHEFNNIMTPILLYAQAALEEVPAESEIAEDLRRVIAAAHRARSLVNRILTFSRDFEARPPGVVSPRAIVHEVLELLRAVVPPNVEIARGRSDDAPVVGDSGMIHQLLMNLCTNAYQAMQSAGGTLTVSLLRDHALNDARVAPGDYLVLEVEDTGPGMDEQTRERIFEPFFTTREVGAGTGLGLSVAHGIASSMAATITVDSEPGRGARFRVYFPVFKAVATLTDEVALGADATPVS